MKKYFLISLIILISAPVFGDSIDPLVYRTIQSQSYRSNYNRQANYHPIPYWQAQSNYMTRNRYYSDDRSYANYSNRFRQYNSDSSINGPYRSGVNQSWTSRGRGK